MEDWSLGPWAKTSPYSSFSSSSLLLLSCTSSSSSSISYLGKKIKAVTVSQRLLTPPITPISLPHKNSHQNVFKTQHTIKLVLAVISKRSNSFVSDHMVLKKSEMKFPRDMSRAQLHNCGDGNGVEYKWNQNEKCWKYKIEMFSIPSRRKLKKN